MTLLGLITPEQANRLEYVSDSLCFHRGAGKYRKADHSLTFNGSAIFGCTGESGDFHNSKPWHRLIEGMNASLSRPAID